MLILRKKINFMKLEKEVLNRKIRQLRLESKNIETGIVNRTLKGKDKNLNSFKKYSTAYTAHRVKNGRNSRPNLTYTGNMLGAITSKNIPNGLRFYFSSKTETDKAVWNQKTRKFFGIDRRQRKYLDRQLSKKPRF